MFGLSRSTAYAVMALARLAEAQAKYGQGDISNGDHRSQQREGAVSARVLAQADGSPAPLLSSVLKRLHQAGLLASKRGTHGGYYLARPPEQVPLIEVIAAIEGPEPIRLTPCCEQDEPRDAHRPGRADHSPAHAAEHAEARSGAAGKPEKPEKEDGCRIMCHCPITGAVRGLNRRMHRFLEQLTLADLLEARASDA